MAHPYPHPFPITIPGSVPISIPIANSSSLPAPFQALSHPYSHSHPLSIPTQPCSQLSPQGFAWMDLRDSRELHPKHPSPAPISRQGRQEPIPGTLLLLAVRSVVPVGPGGRVVGVGAGRALRVAAGAGGAERRRRRLPGARGPPLALAAVSGRRRGTAGAMPVAVLGPLRRGRAGAAGAVSAPPGAGGRRLRPAVSPRRGGRRGRPLARGEREREKEGEEEGRKERRKKEKGDFNGGRRAGGADHNVNAHRIRQATQTLLCTFLSPSTTWVMQTSACKTPKK